MTRAFQKPLGVLAYYWSEGDDSVDRAQLWNNLPFPRKIKEKLNCYKQNPLGLMLELLLEDFFIWITEF